MNTLFPVHTESTYGASLLFGLSNWIVAEEATVFFANVYIVIYHIWLSIMMRRTQQDIFAEILYTLLILSSKMFIGSIWQPMID